MPNVALSRPADLTAARIRRANPSINEETAREDAAIVYDIIAYVQQAYAIPYAEWGGEESDTIETILRTVAGVWSRGDSEWIMEQLTCAERLLGRDDLYKGYLNVCGHVENEDYSWVFEDKRPSDDNPSVEGVTFEDEVVLEDNDDCDDDGHRQRTCRRRPHLQLVTDPERISADDMTRWFHQLMGGVKQMSGKERRRPRRLHLVTRPELTSDDDMTRRFLALMGDSS